MTLARISSLRIVAPALVLFCTACSNTTQTAAPPQQAARTCDSSGSGMSVSPTPATRAAMQAFDAATRLSLSELEQGAARGDAAAQVELGVRLISGKDTAQDADRALKLFEAAGRQDSPLAYYFIGTAFANGIGLPKDDSRAVFYWEHAAQQGYPLAQYWLGFFIAHGRGGIAANWCAALPLLVAAANENIPEASFLLGHAYQQGEIAGEYADRADAKKAAYWYRKTNAIRFNQAANFNLRFLIDTYQVEWQPGDPGKPPPPKPANWDERRPLQPLRPVIPDPSKDATG